ncbi:MAG: hypothetical protein LBR28_02685 [Bacteroidales bacterium]|jgi:molecular chaperone GrpE (heat shock protein)|nr:hypothetical protein [Bacteroidales bacterium]
MKVKHLLLGIAIVALMAACGKKEATETPTTAVETETVEEPVQSAPETTPAVETTKPTAKAEKPAAKKEEPTQTVDPCEAKLAAFNAYYEKVAGAKNNFKLSKKAADAKAYNAELEKLSDEFEKVKDCGAKATEIRNKVLNLKDSK